LLGFHHPEVQRLRQLALSSFESSPSFTTPEDEQDNERDERQFRKDSFSPEDAAEELQRQEEIEAFNDDRFAALLNESFTSERNLRGYLSNISEEDGSFDAMYEQAVNLMKEDEEKDETGAQAGQIENSSKPISSENLKHPHENNPSNGDLHGQKFESSCELSQETQHEPSRNIQDGKLQDAQDSSYRIEVKLQPLPSDFQPGKIFIDTGCNDQLATSDSSREASISSHTPDSNREKFISVFSRGMDLDDDDPEIANSSSSPARKRSFSNVSPEWNPQNQSFLHVQHRDLKSPVLFHEPGEGGLHSPAAGNAVELFRPIPTSTNAFSQRGAQPVLRQFDTNDDEEQAQSFDDESYRASLIKAQNRLRSELRLGTQSQQQRTSHLQLETQNKLRSDLHLSLHPGQVEQSGSFRSRLSSAAERREAYNRITAEWGEFEEHSSLSAEEENSSSSLPVPSRGRRNSGSKQSGQAGGQSPAHAKKRNNSGRSSPSMAELLSPSSPRSSSPVYSDLLSPPGSPNNLLVPSMAESLVSKNALSRRRKTPPVLAIPTVPRSQSPIPDSNASSRAASPLPSPTIFSGPTVLLTPPQSQSHSPAPSSPRVASPTANAPEMASLKRSSSAMTSQMSSYDKKSSQMTSLPRSKSPVPNVTLCSTNDSVVLLSFASGSSRDASSISGEESPHSPSSPFLTLSQEQELKTKYEVDLSLPALGPSPSLLTSEETQADLQVRSAPVSPSPHRGKGPDGGFERFATSPEIVASPREPTSPRTKFHARKYAESLKTSESSPKQKRSNFMSSQKEKGPDSQPVQAAAGSRTKHKESSAVPRSRTLSSSGDESASSPLQFSVSRTFYTTAYVPSPESRGRLKSIGDDRNSSSTDSPVPSTPDLSRNQSSTSDSSTSAKDTHQNADREVSVGNNPLESPVTMQTQNKKGSMNGRENALTIGYHFKYPAQPGTDCEQSSETSQHDDNAHEKCNKTSEDEPTDSTEPQNCEETESLQNEVAQNPTDTMGTIVGAYQSKTEASSKLLESSLDSNSLQHSAKVNAKSEGTALQLSAHSKPSYDFSESTANHHTPTSPTTKDTSSSSSSLHIKRSRFQKPAETSAVHKESHSSSSEHSSSETGVSSECRFMWTSGQKTVSVLKDSLVQSSRESSPATQRPRHGATAIGSDFIDTELYTKQGISGGASVRTFPAKDQIDTDASESATVGNANSDVSSRSLGAPLTAEGEDIVTDKDKVPRSGIGQCSLSSKDSGKNNSSALRLANASGKMQQAPLSAFTSPMLDRSAATASTTSQRTTSAKPALLPKPVVPSVLQNSKDLHEHSQATSRIHSSSSHEHSQTTLLHSYSFSPLGKVSPSHSRISSTSSESSKPDSSSSKPDSTSSKPDDFLSERDNNQQDSNKSEFISSRLRFFTEEQQQQQKQHLKTVSTSPSSAAPNRNNTENSNSHQPPSRSVKELAKRFQNL
jgi:hypothetical protein